MENPLTDYKQLGTYLPVKTSTTGNVSMRTHLIHLTGTLETGLVSFNTIH